MPVQVATGAGKAGAFTDMSAALALPTAAVSANAATTLCSRIM
jgi:hypothetical protein